VTVKVKEARKDQGVDTGDNLGLHGAGIKIDGENASTSQSGKNLEKLIVRRGVRREWAV